MSELSFAECDWCRELDYALWVWKRVQGEDDLAHLLSSRWGIDIAMSRVIANVTRRAYETAHVLNTTEDAVEAYNAVVNAPVVYAAENGVICGYWLHMPEPVRRLYKRSRAGEQEFYRDFVALNPDPLLHQYDQILKRIGERIELSLEKLRRYLERVQDVPQLQREIERLVRRIERSLDQLRELQRKVSESMRDVLGRFRPGTQDYQRMWKEIREYLRIYTGGFEYVLRAIARALGG